MKIGKLPNSVLKNLIIDKLDVKREEVLLRPSLGEDCCAVKNGNGAYVISTDPITGATKNIGRLAVNVACNDIASSGIEPVGIVMTVLLPSNIEEEEISEIIKDVNKACRELNVEIIGGHTEITDAVNRVVISSTVFGNAVDGKFVRTNGAKLHDKVIVTKTVGIEGTAIIAKEKEEELIVKFGNEFVNEAVGFIENIGVLKEGLIAGKFGANSMHDITEGGVYGAAWEVAECSGKGIILYEESIPVDYITKEICNYFNINYNKLISSGSMLITASAEDSDKIVCELKKVNINATIIGEIVEKEFGMKIKSNNEEKELNQPDVDDLYKII